MQTVRFWIYHREGIVKITVTEDAPVTIATGGRTDEGYGYTQESFRLEDGVIHRTFSQWGADCDGSYGQNNESFWRSELGTVPCIEIGPNGETIELLERRPNWVQFGDLWPSQQYAEEFSE